MISREEVLTIAELARLSLEPEEVASLQKDMSSILEYVGQVSASALDTDTDAQPEPRNVLRDDVPRDAQDPLAGKEASLRAAFPLRLPAQAGEGDYNVVRKIIQKDE